MLTLMKHGTYTEVVSDSFNLKYFMEGFRAVLPLLKLGQVSTSIRKNLQGLRSASERDGLWYLGFHDIATDYARAWDKLLMIKTEIKRIGIFWDILGTGLKHSDEKIVVFHRNFTLLLLYPFLVLWHTCKTDARCLMPDEYVNQGSSVMGTGLEIKKLISGDLTALYRMVRWLHTYFSGALYVNDLLKQAAMMQKMKTLSLPLYTAFARVGG